MSSTLLVLFGFVLVLTEHFGSCSFFGLSRESHESEERSTAETDYPANGGITLNFAQGMRDFIVNGNGVSVVQQTVVAFQATLTTGRIGPNYEDDAIKFNDVSLNIGNGYDPSTGKFTAPVEGLYQFNVAYLQANGYTSHVRLIKDASVYSDLHANHKNYDVLSKTVLVVLAKDEIFYVRLEKSSFYAVHGSSRYTQFSGLLVSTTVE